MVQCYSVNHKLQLSRVRKTREATLEIIWKQLEYIAKGHIYSNANNIVLNLKRLTSLAP